MEILKTDIEDVLILKPKVFNDTRGYFFESYSKNKFDRKVAPVDFVQDNESMSTSGVVRGLHFQNPPYAQSKLVRCVRGRVLDIALDIRKGSPTYGKHVAVELSEENHLQLFIPKGFAHGFAVLSDIAVFQYKCDCFYNPDADNGINPLDNSLGIDWRINSTEMVISERDSKRINFGDFVTPFEY
ncbi:MAG: dTDP-4-dehydrorhamnose 3,5-epimerase [Duncaniella sp.]|nr:dTDP-4-dehydrorhamnose 3,5-epimerase [Duncaniella sp.]